MNKKTLILVGAVAVAAYILLFRRTKAATPTVNSAPGVNQNAALIGAGVSAGAKILSSILGGSGGGQVGGQGTGSGIVTERDLWGSKVVGNQIITSLE